LFSHIEARQQSSKLSDLKPSAWPLYACLSQLGRSASECIFVGDSQEDGRSANAASIPFVGVLTGDFSAADLGEFHPIALVNSFSELGTSGAITQALR